MAFNRMIDEAKKIRNAWYPWLRDLPFQINILTGHNDYTKFIILGRSRIGSNLLRGLLNAHSQISAYGEIFRNISDTDWDHMGYFQTSNTVTSLENDSAAFIRQKLFGKYPRYIKAVGFKIFYYHAIDTNVWSYLQADTDIHVLHLKRRNILKTHLSRKKASMINQWVNTSQPEEHRKTFELDYEECLEDFSRTRAWEKEYDKRFEKHPMLELFYEDLATNYTRQVRQIEDFLGVNAKAVQPTTYKQTKSTLREMITNYDELKQKFIDSEWESFFED